MFEQDNNTSITDAYLTKGDFMPHVKMRGGQGQCQEVDNNSRCKFKYR